jgi:phosphatidate cytidylyltransferase
MNIKTVTRLLLFFIAIPVILVLIIFIPYSHHLALNVVAILISTVGTLEMRALIAKRGMAVRFGEALAFGLALPLAAAADLAVSSFFLFGAIATWLAATYAISKAAFRKGGFESILSETAGSFMLLFYPGFFMYFFIALSAFENSTILLGVYVMLIFGNDSLAWATGKLFGRKRGVVAVSPNKSVAGFIGGFSTSAIVSASAFFLFPDIFGRSLPGTVAIACVIGCTTIIGDLIESAFKRSADSKDSGTLIPGRGGVLDSIDSLLFSAPFYFLLCGIFLR